MVSLELFILVGHCSPGPCAYSHGKREDCAFRDSGYSGGMGRERGECPGNCGPGPVGARGGTRGRIAPLYAESAVGPGTALGGGRGNSLRQSIRGFQHFELEDGRLEDGCDVGQINSEYRAGFANLLCHWPTRYGPCLRDASSRGHAWPAKLLRYRGARASKVAERNGPRRVPTPPCPLCPPDLGPTFAAVSDPGTRPVPSPRHRRLCTRRGGRVS